MAPHDEEAYGAVPSNDRDDDRHPDDHHDGGYGGRLDDHDGGYGGGRVDDPYGPTPPVGGRQENPFDDRHDLDDYRPQVGAPDHGPSPFDDSNQLDYRGNSGAGRPYAPPRADDDYDDERPVQFPAGNYDRGV